MEHLEKFTTPELKRICRILKKDVYDHFKGYSKWDRQTLIQKIHDKYDVEADKLTSKIPIPLEEIFKRREEMALKKEEAKQKKKEDKKSKAEPNIAEHLKGEQKELSEALQEVENIKDDVEEMKEGVEVLNKQITGKQEAPELKNLSRTLEDMLKRIEILEQSVERMEIENKKLEPSILIPKLNIKMDKLGEMEKPKKMEEMEKPKKMEEMEKPKKMEEMEKPKKMEEMEKPKKMEEMEKPKKTEKEYLPNITPKQKMTSKMVTTFYNNLEKQPKPEEIKQIKSKSPILQDFYYLYDTLLENLNTKTGAEDAMNFFKNTMISQETDIEIFPDVEKYYENIYDKFKNWNEGNPSETERGIKALDKIFNLFITTETKKSKFDKNVDKLIAQMTNYFGRAASKFGPVETHRAAYEEFINTMIMDIMQLFKENEKTEKTEKPEKLEKIEKLEKPEKSKKSEKLEETEKPKKIETPKKIEKSKKLKKLSPEKMIEEIKELLETIQYYINEDEKIPKDIYEHFYPRLEEYRIMKTEEFEPDFDTEKLKLNNEIGRALKYMDKNRL